MTVSTTTYFVNALGNGATTVFTFPFIADNAAAIQVTYTNVSGVVTVLSPSVYTLLINPVSVGNLWGIGGTVTYPISGSPIPTGSILTIQRVVPYTQDISITNQGAFYPQAVEQGLDLLELQLQQLTGVETLDVKAPLSDGPIDMTLPTKAARAGTYFGFDGNGLPVAIPGTTALPVDLSNFTTIATGGITSRSFASRFSAPLSPYDFGAVGNGIADDSAAFNLFFTAIVALGGTHYILPGRYMCNSQILLTPTGLHNIGILAYGAELYTTGAFAGLKIQGSATPHTTTIYGLKVNHRANATATYGFECVNTANLTLNDCTVEAHGVNISYAALILRNGTAGDPNTGCFWTLINNFTVRKRAGADPGDIPRGIYLRGAANATTIRNGNITLGTTGSGIIIGPESGQTYVSNGVYIDGVAFEGMLEAIRLSNGAGGALPGGLRIGPCRIESATTFIKADSADTETAEPPKVLSGQYLAAGVNYIDNTTTGPLTIAVIDDDNSGNASAGSVSRKSKHYNAEGTYWRTSQASFPVHTFDIANVGQGLDFTINGSATVGSLKYTASGTLEMQGNAGNTYGWSLRNTRGISSTSTSSQNLVIPYTFSASTTCVVPLPITETDTGYVIIAFPAGDPGGRLWLSAKSTTNFTLTSSAATSHSGYALLLR